MMLSVSKNPPGSDNDWMSDERSGTDSFSAGRLHAETSVKRTPRSFRNR